jgi:hypothetical protein
MGMDARRGLLIVVVMTIPGVAMIGHGAITMLHTTIRHMGVIMMVLIQRQSPCPVTKQLFVGLT